jgi:hypothetical protein
MNMRRYADSVADVVHVDGVEAWRRLPGDVRADVIDRALRGLGHPDPQVANAAVAWARHAGRRRWVVIVLWLTFLLFAIAGWPLFAVRPEWWLFVIVLVTVASGAIVMLFLAARPSRFAAIIESANLDVLAGAVGTGGPPAAPVEVRMHRRRALMLLLLPLFLAALELVLLACLVCGSSRQPARTSQT